MSSFFELPPEPTTEPVASPPRYRQPGWQGPPTGAVAGVVPVERVLAQTAEVAVAVTAVEVYPEGLTFGLVAMSALGPTRNDQEGMDPMLYRHAARTRGGIPDAMLRVGVELGDGRRATNTSPSEHAPPADRAVVLQSQGGGGSSDRYRQSFWVWPLPADGAVRIVCEWPAYGIPVTAIDLDGPAVLAAAARSRVLFDDDHLPYPPADRTGWDAYRPL